MRTLTLLICLVATAAVALSQEPPKAAVPVSQANPLSAQNKLLYGASKEILLRSAEKMPEENYNFKPTDAVRSYGQIIGHVADAQYNFCSIVLGEKNPLLKIEQTKTSKADLIAALKGAFAYCDKAYDGITDRSATEMVKLMGFDGPKLGVLNNVTFEQAASVPVAAFTALQGLRDKGQIQPGQKVLINGAAGGVGTFAVQIAKSFGADVTGVCSTRNVDMVRSIGADQVIDYTQEDFTQSGQRYDLIFDTVGNHSLSDNRRVLGSKGTLIMVGGAPKGNWLGPLLPPLKALVMSRFVSQTLAPFLARRSKEDLTIMHDLMAAGKVTPVIDKCYRLSEVPEAIRYLEEGHARGKVVITLKPKRSSSQKLKEG